MFVTFFFQVIESMPFFLIHLMCIFLIGNFYLDTCCVGGHDQCDAPDLCPPKGVCASLRKHGSFQMDIDRAIGPVLLSIQKPFLLTNSLK